MRASRPTTIFILAATLVVGTASSAVAQTDTDTVAGSLVPLPPPFVMEQPSGREIGAWQEIGTAPDGVPIDRLIGAVGERLIGLGNACAEEDGPCADFGWYSTDGVDWQPTALPGMRPSVTDAVATEDGVVAVGYDLLGSGNGQTAAAWSTPDGIEWTPLEAPTVASLDHVTRYDDMLFVTSGERVWSSSSGSDWTTVTSPAVPILAGPGGLLVAAGGGQDLRAATALWHSSDGREWAKVRLPKALRGAQGQISLFPLDDAWVMIPSVDDMPRSILTSPDGLTWQRVPRPQQMVLDGSVFWLDSFGGQVEAYGGLFDDESALWTWHLGEAESRPVVLHGESMAAPVLWRGQQVALGSGTGRDAARTLWRLDVDESELISASVPLTNVTGDAVSVDIVDTSGLLVGAVSGQPGDGASVAADEVVVTNDTPTTLRLTWIGGPCDATLGLTIDATAHGVALDQPACEGDAIGFDRVLLLEFSSPIAASDVQASMHMGS